MLVLCVLSITGKYEIWHFSKKNLYFEAKLVTFYQKPWPLCKGEKRSLGELLLTSMYLH